MTALLTCPGCGELHPLTARYCSSCGAGLVDGTQWRLRPVVYTVPLYRVAPEPAAVTDAPALNAGDTPAEATSPAAGMSS